MNAAPELIAFRGCVYPWHCDHMEHMNVMWYVGLFDQATWQLLSRVGMTPDWLRANGRGMAAVEQTLRYQRELRAGDLVSVHSAVVDVTNKAIGITHEMRNDASGEVAATCALTGVHIDTSTRRAVALPEQVTQLARRLR